MTGPRLQPASISGVFGALVKRCSRRLLGEVPEPIGIYFHSRPVLKTFPAVGSKSPTSKTVAARARRSQRPAPG